MPKVTGLQLDILRVLWAQPGATVQEVKVALRKRRTLAPTTVATHLKRLVVKELVGFEKDGRTYRYSARVDESDVVREAVDEVASEVFRGDLTAFAAELLSRRDVDADSLAEIRALIEAKERELGR